MDDKKRSGEFEIDTMIGRGRKGANMTTNDRCTHLVIIMKLEDKEFARYKEIAKRLDVEFNFSKKYAILGNVW